jgi:hypothetical protein
MSDVVKKGFLQVEYLMTAMKRLNAIAVDMAGQAIENGVKALSAARCSCNSPVASRSHGVTSDSRIICPPHDHCPPRCLTTITRHAHVGETIVVSFKVRNNGNHAKAYALGVRPLTDEHGNAVAQPTLDRVKIEAAPGMAVMAEMRIDLGKGFAPGSVYETDIVIREKAHNQNICFTLYIDDAAEAPEAAPYDEKDIDTHFHHWYHHYYCENKPERPIPPIRTEFETKTEALKSQLEEKKA